MLCVHVCFPLPHLISLLSILFIFLQLRFIFFFFFRKKIHLAHKLHYSLLFFEFVFCSPFYSLSKAILFFRVEAGINGWGHKKRRVPKINKKQQREKNNNRVYNILVRIVWNPKWKNIWFDIFTSITMLSILCTFFGCCFALNFQELFYFAPFFSVLSFLLLLPLLLLLLRLDEVTIGLPCLRFHFNHMPYFVNFKWRKLSLVFFFLMWCAYNFQSNRMSIASVVCSNYLVIRCLFI